MKLRNKKTGEIFEIELIYKSCNLRLPFKTVYGEDVTLSYLNENFEDVKEPLIKDEKIRKAVRAWAEANDIQIASSYTSSHRWYLRAFNDGEQGIDFWLRWEDKPELIENKRYTITELCGEEEA